MVAKVVLLLAALAVFSVGYTVYAIEAGFEVSGTVTACETGEPIAATVVFGEPGGEVSADTDREGRYNVTVSGGSHPYQVFGREPGIFVSQNGTLLVLGPTVFDVCLEFVCPAAFGYEWEERPC